MREILFRGKNYKGEWEYGVPLISESGDVAYMTQMHSYNYRVEPETVGQFTGLTDKNGKKIFEGDILKVWYSSVEIEGFFENLEVHYDEEYATYMAGYRDLYEVASNSEVIGNVFDKPKLLQEK